MKQLLAIAALLAAAACSQQDAPVEELAEEAQAIVDPASEPAPLAKGPYAPRDTCGVVEGAAAFRAQLAQAVEARDANLLVGLAASDVKLDFGGGSGAVELGRRLADPSQDLWAELDRLMALGCAANKQGGITIPWVFEQDMGMADPGYTMLVTGEDVPLFASATGEGQPAATVSWDVVRIEGLMPDAPFQRVELGDETAGYIATGHLRSLLDYRLFASSRNGRWRITSLVRGD